MNSFSIIGAGRVGTSFGCALIEKGFRIEAFSCRNRSSLEESFRFLKEGTPSVDIIQTAGQVEILIISVPDDEIKNVCEELASSPLTWKKRLVIHCSGLLSSQILEPLKKKGAWTASAHPIYSFPKKSSSPEVFKDIYFGLEGEEEGLARTKTIVQKLGSRHLILRARDKVLYHTACSMASNFLIPLLGIAFDLFDHLDIQEEVSSQALLPLVQGTLQNVKKLNVSSSLTGPLVRGDLMSIQKHLDALEEFPSYLEIYCHLALQILEIITKEKNLPPQKIKALKKMLAKK
jgi:predicted short-subunit dehydrogenase-like oxidoreductase (DUF2520 family)